MAFYIILKHIKVEDKCVYLITSLSASNIALKPITVYNLLLNNSIVMNFKFYSNTQ